MRLARIRLAAIAGLIAILVLVPVGFWLAATLRETETSQALAPSTGRFVSTGAGRMFVTEAGPPDGALIVLVHGTAAWSEVWRPVMDHLARRGHRVVAFDVPPFGFSERDAAADYSRATQAGRFVALFDALGLRAPIVVAHSIGAAPTAEAAIRHPERFGGLVLVCGALGLTDGTRADGPLLIQSLLDQPILRDPLIAATATNPWLTKALFSRLVARKDAIGDDLIATLQRPMRLEGSTRALGRWISDLLKPDANALSTQTASYARIAAPAELIWGERDAITPLNQAHAAQRLFPDSGLAVLDGLGHVPQVEDKAAFLFALDRALDRLARRRAEPAKPSARSDRVESPGR